MPLVIEPGCAAAAVHRTLERALREGWRQRALLAATLDGLPQAASPPMSPGAAHSRSTPVTLNETSECVVCLAAPKESLLVPCGHQCVCEQCSATLSLCPLCRAPVREVVRRVFAD